MSENTPPPTGTAATSAHYDRVARAWRLLMGDDLHYGWFATPDEPLAAATAHLTERLAGGATIAPAHVVLDVGCGVGGPARYLAQRYGCRVLGISTSAVGVNLAQQLAEASGLQSRATFEVRDGLATGCASQSFDRVWLLESAHLMEPKAALFAECARVLRPGGRLALCDIIRFEPLSLRALYQQARDFNLLDRVFGQARVSTVDDYAALMHAVGLDAEPVDDISEAVAPTFARWIANAGSHQRQIDALIGEAGRRDFVAACEVLQRLWTNRTLGYACLFANKRS